MTTPKDIANMMLVTAKKMSDTLIAKGTDYSGDTDTFGNFKLSSSITGVPVEKTILVRMADKFARLGGLLDRPPMVADEGIEDTLDDLIGYCILMKGYLKERDAKAKMGGITENFVPNPMKEIDLSDLDLTISDPLHFKNNQHNANFMSKYANDHHVEHGVD